MSSLAARDSEEYKMEMFLTAWKLYKETLKFYEKIELKNKSKIYILYFSA